MRYLRKFNESFKSEKLKALKGSFDDYTKFVTKIKNCIVYLSDEHRTSLTINNYNCIVDINLNKSDNIDDFFKNMASSIDRLEFELDADCSCFLVREEGNTFMYVKGNTLMGKYMRDPKVDIEEGFRTKDTLRIKLIIS